MSLGLGALGEGSGLLQTCEAPRGEQIEEDEEEDEEDEEEEPLLGFLRRHLLFRAPPLRPLADRRLPAWPQIFSSPLSTSTSSKLFGSLSTDFICKKGNADA